MLRLLTHKQKSDIKRKRNFINAYVSLYKTINKRINDFKNETITYFSDCEWHECNTWPRKLPHFIGYKRIAQQIYIRCALCERLQLQLLPLLTVTSATGSTATATSVAAYVP